MLGEHREIARSIATSIRDSGRGGNGAADESEARVFLLRAPSGYGKSRVLQEVYELLRRGSEAPRYWPSLGAGAGHDAAGERRKVLGPDPTAFVWPRDAVPTYAWWHLNCERLDHGSDADFTTRLTEQLKAHTIPLGIALQRGDGALGRRAAEIGEALYEQVRELASGRLESAAIEHLASFVPVPGLDEIIGLARSGARSAKRRWNISRALRRDENTGLVVERAADERITELAAAIHSLASPSVPAIVAVEDLHLMSPGMRLFVDTLIGLAQNDEKHPVYILGTEWPEASGVEYTEWRRNRSGVMKVITVPELDISDIAQIVLEIAPRTSPEVALAAASVVRSPHIAKQWLNLARVSATIRDSDGALTADALANFGDVLDGEIDSIYRARWNELPTDIRQALMLAVVSGVPRPDATVRYVPEVVADAAAAEQVAVLKRAFELAVDPAGWTQAMRDVHQTDGASATRWISRAIDTDLPLSEKQLADFLGRVERRAGEFLVDRLSTVTLDPDAADLPSDALRNEAARFGVRKGGEDDLARGISSAAVLASAYVAALDRYRSGEPADAVNSLLQPLTQPIVREHARLFVAASMVLASAAMDIEPRDLQVLEGASDALARSRELVANSSGFAPDDVALVEEAAWENRLIADALRGRDVSGEIGARVEAVRASTGGDVRAQVLELVELAFVLYQSSRANRKMAASHMRGALDMASQALGFTDPLTIYAGSALLDLVGQDGNAATFVPLTKRLVAGAEGTYGRGDPRTLDLLRQQLRWELKKEPSVQLAERYGSLLTSLEASSGRHSWPTIMCRIEQAQAWGRAGEGDRALSLIDQLINDVRTAFGEGHEYERLARWYREYQILAYNRTQPLTGLVRTSANGESWSRDVFWDTQVVREIEQQYGL